MDPLLFIPAAIVILLVIFFLLLYCCPDFLKEQVALCTNCFNHTSERSASTTTTDSIISSDSFETTDSSGDYNLHSSRRYPRSPYSFQHPNQMRLTNSNRSRQFSLSDHRVGNARGRPRPYLISQNYAYNNEYLAPSPSIQPNSQPGAGSSGSRGGRGPANSRTSQPQSRNKKRSKSKPRAPTTNILDDVGHDIDEMITGLQSNLSQDTSPNKSESIAEAQRLLLLRPLNYLELLGEECPMIIGVDATPATLAGYIVILKERRLEYYVIKRKELPWKLHAEKDPAEFEMKNFMFALTVWKEIILKYRRLAIYTDNFAITKARQFDENNYGERAFKLLTHYIKCEKVVVVNRNSMAVNKNKKLKHFAMYLQPADDLSRWQISTAVKFLTDLYGIDQENVQGTHCLAWSGPTSVQARYKPTARHSEILEHANDIIDLHDCPNPACSGSDLLHASLRSVR